ncbi:MAG TPA: leucyl aminopeptidase family protein [Caulobacteraceae bacterium]|nr:leucyl aminopeptidase family protein [Caulobacteraceae bacterium]
MSEVLIPESEGPTIPLHALRRQDLEAFLARRRPAVRAQTAVRGFKGLVGQTCAVVRGDGSVEMALAGLGGEDRADAMALRAAADKLPAGDYRLTSAPRGLSQLQAAVAWSLGAYGYDRYKPRPDRKVTRLVVADAAELEAARRVGHACALARDMVNTPANDLGPLQIETIAREIAERYGAKLTTVVGDALQEAGYPAVLAVGRAAESTRAPRMIELSWGAEGPLIAVIGKGVVFDTGGLDLKPSSSMRLMKKDMGGAAHALALGRMIMDAGLKLRLVVLVPAVENAVAGEAMRPGDVISTRKGLTIEIGNTDAEGRLILADALARAVELEPELTIDMATLTGAARVALGPQVIPFYTDDDALAGELAAASARVSDPLWRMPLWRGYAEAVEGEIADLRNDPEGWAQAGSVTAALFLQRFAPRSGWVHLDIFAWNPKSRAGWPVGAEAQAIRAIFDMLSRRYG